MGGTLSSFISPPIRQLIRALKSHPEKVEACVAGAESWLLSCQESLKLLAPVLLWSEPVEELLRQANLDLQEALRLVRDRQLLPEARAEALQEAVDSYFLKLFQLQTEEAKRPAYSPVLALDQLIRVAFNVLKDKLDIFGLQSRFPLVHAEVQQLRSQFKLRQTLFPEVTWPPEMQEFLGQVEGGMGALAQFLQQGDPKLLEDAIQLLGKGSSDFTEGMYRTESALKSAQRYSPHDALECWLRLISLPFDPGADATTQAWDRLFQEVDGYFRTLQTSIRAGLSVADPELMMAAGLAHQEAFDQLNQIALEALAPEVVAERLNPAWDKMDLYRGRIRLALLDLQSRFQNAPRVLELVEILGQVRAGILPTWVLHDEVTGRLEQQQKSLSALQQAPVDGEALLPLLESQEQAYQRLLLYAEDENPEHLVEGWKLLDLTMPALIEFESGLRQNLSKSGRSGQQVTCVRCGQVQVPARACSACGSALPQLQIDDVHYQDIAGDPDPQTQLTPVELLAEMAEAIPFGGTTWEQVMEEIVRQVQTLEKTRGRFEREVMKMMGKEDTLDVYCQFFVVRLGQVSQALAALGEAAQGRQLAGFKSALGSYRQLHQELIEFQQRINEGLGKSHR